MAGVGGVLATGMYTGTNVSDAFLVVMTLVLIIALLAMLAVSTRRGGGHHPHPQ